MALKNATRTYVLQECYRTGDLTRFNTLDVYAAVVDGLLGWDRKLGAYMLTRAGKEAFLASDKPVFA